MHLFVSFILLPLPIVIGSGGSWGNDAVRGLQEKVREIMQPWIIYLQQIS